MVDMASEIRKSEFRLDTTKRADELGLSNDEFLDCLLNMAYFYHILCANTRRDLSNNT